jgi:hypothetical protein
MGTHGVPRAALRRKAGARAQAIRGAPGAALRREVGAGARGTRGPLELPCIRRRVLEPRRHVALPELH